MLQFTAHAHTGPHKGLFQVENYPRVEEEQLEDQQ